VPSPPSPETKVQIPVWRPGRDVLFQIDVEKSAYHQQSRNEIRSDNPLFLTLIWKQAYGRMISHYRIIKKNWVVAA